MAASTNDEVDRDRRQLSKGDDLTLEGVDALIERKELEYTVEQEHGVNPTNVGTSYAGHDYAGGAWSVGEIEQVDWTLDRLPTEHVHGEGSFHTINRAKSHWLDPLNGYHANREIHMFDGALVRGGRHDGDRRDSVEPEFWVEHGDEIKAFENTLAHEIGHDVADTNQSAFEKFKVAGGWRAVDEADLIRDGIDADKIAAISNGGQTVKDTPPSSDTSYYTKNSDDPNHAFWAQDKTAIPANLEESKRQKTSVESVSDDTGRETWGYAKSNPSEHFADIYAKAVHVPAKLHADLIELPRAAVQRAQAELAAARTRLRMAEGPGGSATNDDVRADVAAAAQRLAQAETAEAQRREQFRIMRNDVFHTDKATAAARRRIASLSGPTKLEEFDKRAAKLSTPEQIEALEAELSS